MSQVLDILEDIHQMISPSDETLEAVRTRRDDVLKIAGRYSGSLRTYKSGSMAHRTANDDTDADCGIVLDRRTYYELGPDGEGGPPNDIVEEVRTFLRNELKEKYPDIFFRLTKRAIKITFNDPLLDGTDPSVDLIVALTRADGALWIPNLEKRGWDVSDPECHTRLLTAEPAGLRRMRAKVIRLAKAWNKQYSQPGLCSFNIEALALQIIQEETDIAEGLYTLLNYAATDLSERNTLDPAGVSAPIKTLIEREKVADRLKKSAQKYRNALDSEDEDEIIDSLANVYWVYVAPPEGSSSRAAFANTLRQGNSSISVVPGTIAIGASRGLPLKTTRSFGGKKNEAW